VGPRGGQEEGRGGGSAQFTKREGHRGGSRGEKNRGEIGIHEGRNLADSYVSQQHMGGSRPCPSGDSKKITKKGDTSKREERNAEHDYAAQKECPRGS